MSKAARLEPLADYAGKVETQAARRLAASAQALAAKEREVEQLRGYLAEYRQRAALTDSTTDPLRWQNARAFLSKLCAVVAMREAELAKAVESYRMESERWRDSHRRTKGLDKIVADAAREAEASDAKRAQRELDEHALRRMLERG
jgi:flagellar export protein FliJ